MRIAYFDCPSGIAGNMILGALIDAGLDPGFLKRKFSTLDIGPWTLDIRKKSKAGVKGTSLEVKVKSQDTPRGLRDILSIIKRSRLSTNVKRLSTMIFRRLAEAEAKVHAAPLDTIHFHEVGAVDAIIDIVGACIGLEKLGIEKIYCSPLPHGKGTIKHTHGILPNPAPATVELLKGIPTYQTNIQKELVTPTGAAIISTLAESFGDLPRMKVENMGYGAGTFNLPFPNLLRIFIGEAQIPAERDAVLQIETNIDDMDPKLYDRAIAGIMKAGALDASVQPIRMKKFREAVKLVVLCRPEDKDKILDAVFTETTTIGVRIYLVQREKLRREIRAGKKISYLGPQIKSIKSE